MAVKHVVVDGSNIATEGRSVPSLAQLDEAVRAFLDERPHDALTVVVDATFEHRIEPSERRMYDDALTANELITPPAGTIGRGDKFLLEIADRVDATVFSNDSFQEFHGEYEWLFDEGRLVGGKPVAGVGWIFTERTPVRGPKSRMATRAAGKKRVRNAAAAPAKKAASRTPRRQSVSLGPVPVPTADTPPPAASSRRRSSRGPRAVPVEDVAVEPATTTDRLRRRRTGAGGPAEPVNRPLPFIEFIAEHPVGSLVDGEVVEFASHGAYVQVGDVRCYLPLKSMGDPPPRSAREVLDRGVLREFVVAALDAPRRGIDLALPGAVDLAGRADDRHAPAESLPAAPPSARTRGRRRAVATTANMEAEASRAETQAPARAGASLPQSEATLAKQPAAKAAAKRATASKASAAKSTAKKTTAKKATTGPATRARAGAAKSPSTAARTTKATTTRVAAKKAVTKAPASKATPRKAAAAKSTTKAASTRKAPAKATAARTTARAATKSPAKTAAAKAAPARKSVAKKATTVKASAAKSAATKTAARKSVAKAPAKKTAATAKKATTRTATKAPAKRA